MERTDAREITRRMVQIDTMAGGSQILEYPADTSVVSPCRAAREGAVAPRAEEASAGAAAVWCQNVQSRSGRMAAHFWYAAFGEAGVQNISVVWHLHDLHGHKGALKEKMPTCGVCLVQADAAILNARQCPL